MVIQYVGSNGASRATPSPVGTFTVTMPTGTKVGDLMLAVLDCDTAASGLTITLTGWTLCPAGSGANPDQGSSAWKTVSYYYRFYSDSDATGAVTSWGGTISGGGSLGDGICCASYAGVDPASPFIANQANHTLALQTTHALTSVANTVNGAWWVGLFGAYVTTGTSSTTRNWSSMSVGTLRQHPAADQWTAAGIADSGVPLGIANFTTTGTLSVSANELYGWIGILRPLPSDSETINYAAISRASRW